MSDDFDIVLIFAFSAVVFMYVIFCLFGYSKSGFWQTFVFIDAINKSKSLCDDESLVDTNGNYYDYFSCLLFKFI